jgi:DNA-binding FrmR family transcriptional regulator
MQTTGNLKPTSKLLKGALKKGVCPMAHTHPDHEAVLVRLNRAVGQIKGVSAMISERRYCVDILNQLKAAQAALKRVEGEVLETHIRSCIQDAFASKNSKAMDRKVKELIKLLTG